MSTALPPLADPVTGAKPARRWFHVRVSAAATALLLCIGWMVAGLVGHEPWKPDEAESIAVVRNILAGKGDWVVPTLAGENVLDAPPLIYLVAMLCVKLFARVLSLPDAVRVASGVFMALTFWFTALTAKELYGRDYAAIAAIALLGCVGLLVRGHQPIPDVPLLTGVALGLFGLALAPRRPLVGGVALGTGIGIGFLARGLFAPVVLMAIVLVLGVGCRQWRRRRFLSTLGVAALTAVPWLLIWPIALYRRSPGLFHDWLAQDIVGSLLLGRSAQGTRAWHEYLELLPWYAWPVLPLALWTMWYGRRGALKRPEVQLPLIAFLVMFSILGLTAKASDVYALPLLLPLTLLAVASLDTLRRGAISALDWFGIMTFGLIAILLWVAWIALLTGWPPGIARQLATFQPGFDARFAWFPFLVAAACTFLWAALVARTMPTTRRALVNWGGGITLMWILASTLWLPYVDAGKSYQGVVADLAGALPKGYRCISSVGLGESQRAMLEYYAGIVTYREELPQPKRECDVLLTQGTVSQDLASGAGWKNIWEGARPGDNKERFRLYKRVARKS